MAGCVTRPSHLNQIHNSKRNCVRERPRLTQLGIAPSQPPIPDLVVSTSEKRLRGFLYRTTTGVYLYIISEIVIFPNAVSHLEDTCLSIGASPGREPTHVQHLTDLLVHDPRLLGPVQIPSTNRKMISTVHRKRLRRKRRSLLQRLRRTDPNPAVERGRQARQSGRAQSRTQ